MEKETARIEAFSDGVFAIAITLLILEIKIPTAGSGDLSRQLIRQWPSYFAFVISFAFIGIMWINHHRLFTHIKRSNNVLLFFEPSALTRRHRGTVPHGCAGATFRDRQSAGGGDSLSRNLFRHRSILQHFVEVCEPPSAGEGRRCVHS
jgi:hypothetical protein